MGSDSQRACLVALNESWGNTKLETRVSKLGLRRVHVDFGFMLLTGAMYVA